MTQILITIPDGASGKDAAIMTLVNGEYSLPASVISNKKILKTLVDATRETTMYYQDALRELEMRRSMLKQRGFNVEEDNDQNTSFNKETPRDKQITTIYVKQKVDDDWLDGVISIAGTNTKEDSK